MVCCLENLLLVHSAMQSTNRVLVFQKDNFLQNGSPIELVLPEALPRLRVLADTMMEGKHEGFTRVYVDIRSQGIEAIFCDMGLKEYNWIYFQVGKLFIAELWPVIWNCC